VKGIRPVIRDRRRRLKGEEGREGEEFIEIDPGELSGLFVAPRWLRDAGVTAWLLVGVVLLVVGIVWVLSLTDVIVLPLVTAGVTAAVAGQLVAWLKRRGVPRGLGAGLVLLLVISAGALATPGRR
jgi:putative heme transporter